MTQHRTNPDALPEDPELTSDRIDLEALRVGQPLMLVAYDGHDRPCIAAPTLAFRATDATEPTLSIVAHLNSGGQLIVLSLGDRLWDTSELLITLGRVVRSEEQFSVLGAPELLRHCTSLREYLDSGI